MALIKCSECGKEVSDRATTCPHCGCPMVAENHCVINGLDVDCSFIFNNEYDQEIKELIMMEKTNLDLQIIEKIVYEWSVQGKIPPVFNGKVSTWEEDNKKILSQQSNKPKCPICNSTNLSKISTVKKATKVGLFGIFGAGDVGKTWKCNNCGSKF